MPSFMSSDVWGQRLCIYLSVVIITVNISICIKFFSTIKYRVKCKNEWGQVSQDKYDGFITWNLWSSSAPLGIVLRFTPSKHTASKQFLVVARRCRRQTSHCSFCCNSLWKYHQNVYTRRTIQTSSMWKMVG